MGKFDGKVVLVTGGNRNTGLAIVRRFLRDGAMVFFCGSSEASTQKGVDAPPTGIIHMDLKSTSRSASRHSSWANEIKANHCTCGFV